jgi:hypothetical protein
MVGSLFRPFGPGAFFLASDPEVTLTFDEARDGLSQRLLIAGYGEPTTGARTTSPA